MLRFGNHRRFHELAQDTSICPAKRDMSQFCDTRNFHAHINLRLFLIADSAPAYHGMEVAKGLDSLARHSDVAGRWSV
jgi:hypothetical protein